MVVLKGWRYAAFISGVVGIIGLAVYPVIISPMMDVDKYKKIQAVTRSGIDQEKIQPGNMRVWSNPFGPRE